MTEANTSMDQHELGQHNRGAWNKLVQEQCPWSKPVSSEVIEQAKKGQWTVYITPQPMPEGWLPASVAGLKILCLASGGGQQAPVLAAAGADVTVVDISEGQLDQDRMVAERDGLTLELVRSDMADLSAFADNSFDLIVHPISNLYVPSVLPVWKECYRVLKTGGKLLSSFYNPVVFIGDRDPKLMEEGLIRPRYSVPYADVKDLDAVSLQQKMDQGQALVFGHSLTDQIGGQLQAGLVLTGFYEDKQPNPRFVVDHFLPTFMATCSQKLA